jgi:hypothetical protein
MYTVDLCSNHHRAIFLGKQNTNTTMPAQRCSSDMVSSF